jgi:formylglycine-generating enzyme required for sulfatase activity
MVDASKSPKVFISYAWEDDIRPWIRQFATRLRSNGVETILDQWGVAPGDSLPEFMESSVNASDFVLVVCTSAYKKKSDSSDPSGVGYEKGVITGELFVKRNQRKFIPILRKGKWWEAAPSWASGKNYIDLSGDPYDEENYQELLRTLYGKREPPPPLGIPPDFSTKKDNSTEIDLKTKKNARREKIEGHIRGKDITGGSVKKVISKPKRRLVIGVGGLLSVSTFCVLAWWLFNFYTTPHATPTFQETSFPTPLSTATKPSRVDAPTIIITPTNVKIIGTDGMLLMLVPAGEFMMGSKGNAIDERPVHTVYLDEYYIDQTEVTNSMYAICVNKGICDAPRENISNAQNAGNNSFYYGNAKFDSYPVIYVSWNDAKAYCRSVGRRLPTEAEWEKAASWDDAKSESRVYPWGNSIDCSYANYYGGENKTLCAGDTTPVGSYPNGNSFYGVLDMAGNVSEWVADRYDPAYYGNSPYTNPFGPASGDFIVVRGGSFLVGSDNNIRSSDRYKEPPDFASHQIGFRCAVDATP